MTNRFFIKAPFAVSKKIRLTLPLVLSFFLVVFESCSPKPNEKKIAWNQLTEESKECLREFFEELFDQSPAIYTFLGSKPVSGITIDVSTQEVMLRQNHEAIEALPPTKKKKALDDIQKYYSQKVFMKNWEKLTELQKQSTSQDFLFRLQPTNSSMYIEGLVANSALVIDALIQNYDVFSKELEMQFDPFEVALDFENIHSDFWNTIFQNHYLQGILFGYGTANAYLFSEYINTSEPRQFPVRSYSYNADKKYGIVLPSFRSFFIDDPVVQRYRLERKRIAARLKGNDIAPYFFSLLYDENDG